MEPDVAAALDQKMIDSLKHRELPPMEPGLNLFGPENLIKDTPEAWIKSDLMRGAMHRATPISKLSGGRVELHCLKMVEDQTWDGFPLHYHEVDIQIICVTRGWMRFFFEGAGEILLEKGDIVYQPSKNRHRQIAASPDLELFEIIIPNMVSSTIYNPNDETGGWDIIKMSHQKAEDYHPES